LEMKIFFSNFASLFNKNNTLFSILVKKVYAILFLIMLACIGCQWQLKPHDSDADLKVSIERYDRIESQYLTTGDYSALQQMNTYFPQETRTLIEDVLQLGHVNDPGINHKFLHFFQDSTLQVLIGDVQQQFANMDDINESLSQAFMRLKEELPSVEIPEVYTQVGSFDQSIIVGNNILGISLDKYLGADYPFYCDHYTERQRQMMTRSMIVPDCLGFYILSLFPLPNQEHLTQADRDIHMGKIQWVVNQVMQRNIFQNNFVKGIERYMHRHQNTSFEQLLRQVNVNE